MCSPTWHLLHCLLTFFLHTAHFLCLPSSILSRRWPNGDSLISDVTNLESLFGYAGSFGVKARQNLQVRPCYATSKIQQGQWRVIKHGMQYPCHDNSNLNVVRKHVEIPLLSPHTDSIYLCEPNKVINSANKLVIF